MKSIYSRQVTIFMLPLLLLVAGAVLFTGCESDPVAPHTEAPALTEEQAAHQAAYLGVIFKEVGVNLVSYQSSEAYDKQVYTYTIPAGSGIVGVVFLDYRLGSIDGTPATYDEGNYGRLYTMPDAPLIFALGDLGGYAAFAFDLQASINQATSTATVLDGSVGTLTSGDYTAEFSFFNVVVVDGHNYPSSGTITFSTGSFVMILEYDGDNTATITIGGVLSYIINLDDGELTGI